MLAGMAREIDIDRNYSGQLPSRAIDLSREGRYLAAVLAAGEGAVLSHRAAADLWELRASKGGRIDVTARSDRRGDHSLLIHRDAIADADTMTHNGIPVTKPLRTVLDLAGCIGEKELERAIRQTVYRRLTTTASLAEAVSARAGHRGMGRMRNAPMTIGEAPVLTRSELEEDFLCFLRRHRLPLPELNVSSGSGNGASRPIACGATTAGSSSSTAATPTTRHRRSSPIGHATSRSKPLAGAPAASRATACASTAAPWPPNYGPFFAE
jgi:hypothetical protein